MHVKKIWIILPIIIFSFLFLTNSVFAMDNYTHDADIYRDNTVVDSGFNGIIYNNDPYYVELPLWDGIRQFSSTTPAVVGSKLYMYTYDDPKSSSDYGHLWEVDLTKPQASWTAGSAVSLTAKLIQNFYAPPSGDNGQVNSAAGVSGPTISQGYIAIAVGEYLYWWPVDQPSQMESKNIQGNAGNDIQLIAASPLITPPLTVSGMDMITGLTTTWQTSFAVVGSWSGGVISQPLFVPNNVIFDVQQYKTTNDTSNATNDIVTSSPAWDSQTTAVGSVGAAVFGVDAAQSGENRLILMDPTTGNYKTVYQSGGSDIFYGPIDSSPAIETNGSAATVPTGTIFVPDQGAAVYELSANGDYWGDDTSAMDQSNPCIANIALDGQNVIWVGKGHTTLNESPIALFGHGSISIPNFTGLNSPAVVVNNNNGSTDTVFITSTSQDGLLVTNPMAINNLPVAFQQANQNQTWKQTWQTLGSVSPAYCAAAADVGTDSTDGSALHYLATWTNYGYNTAGCIELWAPASYSVTASANPNVLDSGDQTMINASPNPEGITQSITAEISGGGKTYNLTLVKNWSDPEKWGYPFTAPDNYTGSSVTYTVTVTATNMSGETANATTTFSVNPIPLPPPGNLSGSVDIIAYRRSGATQPAGTAKYSDDLATTLTVNQPPPPSGLLDAVVTDWRITKAWVDTPQGVIDRNGVGHIQIDRSTGNIKMTLYGHTAYVKYKENWAGYPPPIPDNTVMETDDINIPFAVLVDYKYLVPVPTGKGGVTYVWRYGSYDASGNASTTLNITGTEVYIYNEYISNNGGPVWEP